jgi:amidohydrolase
MELLTRIQAQAKEIHSEVVRLRRHIHANPELSYQERETSAFVKAFLREQGITQVTECADTGVVALIEGKPGGKTIALRADMDALPITEENSVDYRSTRSGVMHACGHDAHTSSLLGTARILHSLRGEFTGTVKLIFQPGEEKLPGGASLMIKDGVLRNPDVQGILGQHVMPFLDAGKIGMRKGMYMASADEIYLTIHGKGGHGAQPHSTIDPVAIMAQVITATQTVVSRTADPRIPSVLTWGKVVANGATNIIPDSVYLEGTFRTFDEPWRAKAHQKIADIVNGVTAALGGRAELDIQRGYPVLFNDEALTARARDYAAEYVGSENIVDLDLWPAAEDFAWYSHEVPGCFYRLGTRNEALGIVHGLHTPKFNIDESALGLSTGLMAWMAVRELEG